MPRAASPPTSPCSSSRACCLPTSSRRASQHQPVAAGDRFVIAGYGATAIGSDTGAGTPRAAAMVATGKPGSLQIRLVDPAGRGERAGLGACTGDFGGPAFVESGGVYSRDRRGELVNRPADTAGCGGLTGVTPLVSHRAWIVETAQRLGSPITP